MIEYEKKDIYKAYYDHWFNYVRVKISRKRKWLWKKFYAIKIFMKREQNKMKIIAHSSHIKVKLHDLIICEGNSLHVYYQAWKVWRPLSHLNMIIVWCDSFSSSISDVIILVLKNASFILTTHASWTKMTLSIKLLSCSGTSKSLAWGSWWVHF